MDDLAARVGRHFESVDKNYAALLCSGSSCLKTGGGVVVREGDDPDAGVSDGIDNFGRRKPPVAARTVQVKISDEG